MSIASVSVPVPLSGDGSPVSIATLVGAKTVILTGLFKGRYTILAAHQAGKLVPVLQFDAGGEAGIEQTLPDAYQFIAVRTNVNTGPIGAAVTVTINGVVGVGQNKFASVAALNVGASGAQPSIDTNTLFSSTGLEEGISFICEGTFEGNIIVEGSEDNANWNPIGQFSASDESPSLLGTSRLLEFAPLPTLDLVRYVRVNVDGVIMGLTNVTIGGRIPAAASAAVSAFAGEDSTGRSTSLNAAGEELLYEEPVDLSSVAVGQLLTPSFAGVIGFSGLSAGLFTGTFRLYLGSTTPGDTVGATLLATIAVTTTILNTKTLITVTGAPFPNPGGTVLVQITGANDSSFAFVSMIFSSAWRLL
jgi:hypothetical protein